MLARRVAIPVVVILVALALAGPDNSPGATADARPPVSGEVTDYPVGTAAPPGHTWPSARRSSSVPESRAWACQATIPAPDGPVSLWVTATDRAGNVSPRAGTHITVTLSGS